MTNVVNILVFKTNINNEDDRLRIADLLDNHPLIEAWNVDLEDCDKVLRIVSPENIPDDIIALVKSEGLECSELE